MAGADTSVVAGASTVQPVADQPCVAAPEMAVSEVAIAPSWSRCISPEGPEGADRRSTATATGSAAQQIPGQGTLRCSWLLWRLGPPHRRARRYGSTHYAGVTMGTHRKFTENLPIFPVFFRLSSWSPAGLGLTISP
jgi:hypothetical protein